MNCTGKWILPTDKDSHSLCIKLLKVLCRISKRNHSLSRSLQKHKYPTGRYKLIPLIPLVKHKTGNLNYYPSSLYSLWYMPRKLMRSPKSMQVNMHILAHLLGNF